MIHGTVLTAVGAFPLGVLVFLIVVNRTAAAGRPSAVAFVSSYNSADPALKLGAACLVMAGAVHLGLVPAHIHTQPVTAILFVINGAGGLVLAVAAFGPVAARSAALLWLMLTAVAYCAYVLAGLEALDGVGIWTLAVEFIGIVSLGLMSNIKPPIATLEIQKEIA